MKIGDLVKYHFDGKIGIIVAISANNYPVTPLAPLTRFYVEWVNAEPARWISAMNLRIVQ